MRAARLRAGRDAQARCARLDDELVTMRADVGARGEPAERGPNPALDDRLPGLLLDALVPIEAAIARAVTGAPYTAMRAVMGVDEERRREFACAALSVAAAHHEFFAKHRSVFEFLAAYTAISAGRMDCLLTLVDAERAGARLPIEPYLARQAVVFGLITFAPVLLLAGFVICKSLRKE